MLSPHTAASRSPATRSRRRTPRRSGWRWVAALALACVAPAAWASDPADPAMSERFVELALRAEAALSAEGPEAAIRIYEAELGGVGNFGRVHLRLGQLYQRLEKYGEAAYHYRICQSDVRVDELDRRMICDRGFEAVTAPFEVESLPPGGRASILEPDAFAGPFRSGDRLPLGAIVVSVEAPGHRPQSTPLTLTGPMIWPARLGLRTRDGPLVPADFIGEGDAQPAFAADGVEPAGGGRWPAYVTAGVGAALVGGGIFLGLNNRSELEDVRARQSTANGCGLGFCSQELSDAKSNALLADGLWIGGVVALAGSVVLYFLLDDAAPSSHEPAWEDAP